jgi:Ca-activated chloride channel family protein
MAESRASSRRASVAALLFVLACAYGVPALVAPAGAQQETNVQRPRRVGREQPRGDAPARKDDSGPQSATPTPRGGAGEEVDEDDVVRVDTQLVSVPAVVTDRTGRPVTNLRAADFQVFEDGRPQQLAAFATTDAPFEVALLLDTSGSTRSEVGLIKRAAEAFIEALRPGDRVAIVGFTTKEENDTKLATVEVLTFLTSDRDALRDAVEMVGASAGTPFYDSLERIAAEIFRDKPREDVRGRRALVALTDGVDSTSASDFEEARERLKRAGVVSYFVQVNTEDFVEERLMRGCEEEGAIRLSRAQLERYRRLFGARADSYDFNNFCQMGQFERMDISRALYRMARREMDELAKESGGKTFPVADLKDARGAFRQVAREIGTQYSLGYYSTNKARDGSFRNIRVQVRSVRDAQVRAREGYQAPRS